ncbi:MAG: xanthine dehydrogenase family protein molybdopterin-binding subunit [Xanthobacteraceae bacterium]
MKFGVGQPHVRVEDPSLLTGRGRYLADAMPHDALRAAVVRSPHAHARFRIGNLAAVKRLPGVRLVLAGEDTAGYGHLPCQGTVKPADEEQMWVPPYPLLAEGVVRHVGDAVAFIVADSLDKARDASEALEIEWEELPAIADIKGAAASGAPLVWDERGGNAAFTSLLGDREATERAFAGAHRTVKLEIVNQRVVANYMETRGAIAWPAANGEPLKLIVSTQGSHTIRNALCDKILKIPHDQLRVITGDVGGGFGAKLGPYREYALAVIAARQLDRAVAWIADRSEHFLGDAHGRDNFTVAEMALDKNNRFLAMRVDTIGNMGAYLAYFGPFIVANGATMLPGAYAIPTMFARVRGIYTHTLPVDAYRGAGRPEASYVIERLVDAVAREVGIGTDEIRRINFIPASAMPYKTATGRTYDSGDFVGHLARAQETADWKGFEKRARAAQKSGRVRGIGLSCYIEACGGVAGENAKVRIEPDGTATLHIGTQSNGQGHATAYAQFVADELDLPLEKIVVHQGDTRDLPTGGGTGGSRSLPTGGPSVGMAAKKLAGQLKELASEELEAPVDKLEIVDGAVRVIGSNRLITFAALASKHENDPKLVAQDIYQPRAATYPNGTHICEVEVDPDSGAVAIVGYWVVDDFGFTINPLLLEGQIHGGVGQGVGQALSEQAVYDASGQLLTASLMDYALPHARDMGMITFETRNIPCTTHVLGVKGAGEAGTIGACPAVMNAVIDALDRGFGIKSIDMPATPARVWQAIHGRK